MKAYNLYNIIKNDVKQKVTTWHHHKLLSTQQHDSILKTFEIHAYSPTIFVKIGLFIFVNFIALSLLGFYILLFSSGSVISNSAFLIVSGFLFSVGCLLFLESVIAGNKVYNTGTDEALLYASIGFLIATFSFWIKDHSLLNSFVLVIVFGLAVYRYADRLVTLAFCFSIYATVFLLLSKLGDIGKATMPFAMMLFSFMAYLYIKKAKQKTTLLYWIKCIEVTEYVFLIVLYAACNYYVIRESSVTFFNLTLMQGEDIPLAFLFYVLTAVVPIIYIYLGLRKRYKPLLWSGLLLVAFSALTFRYYFSLGHPEIALTIAGVILIAIAYFFINYLKIPKHGITFKQNEDGLLNTNAEAFIIAETLSTQANGIDHEISFGGGESGGAGSGGTY